MDTLFQIEDHVEPGIGGVLQASGIPVFEQQGILLISTPRVEIQCQVGKHTGHKFAYRGIAIYSAWECTIRYRIVTNRDAEESDHSYLRGQVRMINQPFAQKLNALQLPFHVLSVIMEHGSEPMVEDEYGNDTTNIYFDGIVSIRNDAWPA